MGGAITLDERLARDATGSSGSTGTPIVGLDATARLPLAPQDRPKPEAPQPNPATARVHNGRFNNQAPH